MSRWLDEPDMTAEEPQMWSSAAATIVQRRRWVLG